MIGLLKRWLSAWVMVILNLNLPLGSVECFGIAWSANQHMSGRKAYGCNFRDIAQWHASADDSVTPSRRDEEIVACRIVLSGDVQGGYYRSCVMNEAGRFRQLMGTMTPPDDTNTAEIYVEGKRNQVEGFVRWCRKADKKVALNQKIVVNEILDEEPTGLYDGFYVRTR